MDSSNIKELEQKIFDYLECKYQAKFCGALFVHKKDKAYTLDLITSNYMAPISITFDCESDDEFFHKITEELGTRDLVRVKYFKLNLNGEKRK